MFYALKSLKRLAASILFVTTATAVPPLPDGPYTIVNQRSSLLLDLPTKSSSSGTQDLDSELSSGAAIITGPPNDKLNQRGVIQSMIPAPATANTGPVVQSLTLVSTLNNLPVSGYDPILPGAALNLSALPSGLTIKANVSGTNSILFSLDGATHLDPQGPPLSLCGDNDAAQTYKACSNLTIGTHTLTAIPYSSTNGTGSAGDTYTLQFTVTSQASGNPPARALYAVNQEASVRGSISVYDIDAGHKLFKTIATVSGVGEVRGVAANAMTGKLYVSYNQSNTGAGYVYSLDLKTDTILWNRAIPPDVDRLAVSPDGKTLYVPTGEYTNCNFINVLDAATGDLIRTVQLSNHSHDAQYPLSGPLFQITHATDGSGQYMYIMDPTTYAVSSVGPYLGVLGPFAVDSKSHYVVNNINGVWGMQVANLSTNQIVTALIPNPPEGNPGLLHGIGWTPDQTEVWMNGNDTYVYVWDMLNPMAPVFKQTLTLPSSSSHPHWLTFDIKGDYGYVSPGKNSASATQIFMVSTHTSAGLIGSSEDLLEIDFDLNGNITQVGDQYGIGRALGY